jgi:hypothetical protein
VLDSAGLTHEALTLIPKIHDGRTMEASKMSDDWQRSTDETNASVDSALDSMGAPDYTPPADSTGGGTSSFADGRIRLDDERADGSRSTEWIDPNLNYQETTYNADGSRSGHDVNSYRADSWAETNRPGEGLDRVEDTSYYDGRTVHDEFSAPDSSNPLTAEDREELGNL